LSVLDFVKLITVQRYNMASLRRLGPSAIALAEAEGLIGHADAIRTRGIQGPEMARIPREGRSHD
jgi:histidinol dehydrogenase